MSRLDPWMEGLLRRVKDACSVLGSLPTVTGPGRGGVTLWVTLGRVGSERSGPGGGGRVEGHVVVGVALPLRLETEEEVRGQARRVRQSAPTPVSLDAHTGATLDRPRPSPSVSPQALLGSGGTGTGMYPWGLDPISLRVSFL